MDENDTITALQSTTVRSALAAIILNTLTLLSLLTGKALDLDFINQCVNYGIPMFVNAITIYLAYKSYRGRINATQVIRKEAP